MISRALIKLPGALALACLLAGLVGSSTAWGQSSTLARAAYYRAGVARPVDFQQPADLTDNDEAWPLAPLTSVGGNDSQTYFTPVQQFPPPARRAWYECPVNDYFAAVTPYSPTTFCNMFWPTETAQHGYYPKSGDPFDDGSGGRACESCASCGTAHDPNHPCPARGDPFASWCPALSWAWGHFMAQYAWENVHVFVGPQGFTGPPDRGRAGNFGFHEGVAWGMPLWDEYGIGYQKGIQFVQSDFNGGNGLVAHQRTQYFVTLGIFRRATGGRGVQGGVAVDWLDDRYYVSMSMAQLRTEISYLGPWGLEGGFWAATHLDSNTKFSPVDQRSVSWRATDQYNFFVRHNLANGGNGRLWAGITGNGDPLVGGDALMPLTPRWALQGQFNYKLPQGVSAIDQAFALSVNLIWWPAFRTQNSHNNPYRHLFTVADNATFLVNVR